VPWTFSPRASNPLITQTAGGLAPVANVTCPLVTTPISVTPENALLGNRLIPMDGLALGLPVSMMMSVTRPGTPAVQFVALNQSVLVVPAQQSVLAQAALAGDEPATIIPVANAVPRSSDERRLKRPSCGRDRFTNAIVAVSRTARRNLRRDKCCDCTTN